MQTVLHVYPEELNSQFLTLLKGLSKNKKLTITVQEKFDQRRSWRDGLLAALSHRPRAVDAGSCKCEQRKNLITVTPEELLAGVFDEED